MNSLVGQLGDQLAEALASQPHLKSSLRDTVAACASLANQVGQSKAEGGPPLPQDHTQYEILSSPQGHRSILPSPERPLQGRLLSPGLPNSIPPLQNLVPLQSPPSSDGFTRPRTAATSQVELSTFISRLRLACAYNAFETLSSATVTMDSIRNKFCFLLSLMSREHLTSYYRASLQAQIDQSALVPWEGVPSWGLGGAGSHYRRPSSSSPRGGEVSTQQDWPQVDDPLLAFSAQLQENLDDTWFDAHDLEGYLKERRVCLTVDATTMSPHEAFTTCIDAVRLLRGMCLCLLAHRGLADPFSVGERLYLPRALARMASARCGRSRAHGYKRVTLDCDISTGSPHGHHLIAWYLGRYIQNIMMCA